MGGAEIMIRSAQASSSAEYAMAGESSTATSLLPVSLMRVVALRAIFAMARISGG